MLIVISTFALDFIHIQTEAPRLWNLEASMESFLQVAQGKTLSSKNGWSCYEHGVCSLKNTDDLLDGINNLGLKFFVPPQTLTRLKDLSLFGVDPEDNNQKRLRDLENGQYLSSCRCDTVSTLYLKNCSMPLIPDTCAKRCKCETINSKQRIKIKLDAVSSG